MKQKIVRRASALVLAGCLLAGAALPALAASAKEEVIYANLDASGTVTGVYAVNSFAVQAGDTVTDHGSYRRAQHDHHRPAEAQRRHRHRHHGTGWQALL